MRSALRSRQNIHVTRKDIAQFAGITPALVTYYFPDKDSLIEATTVPIVAAMVEAVANCLSAARDERENLLRAIAILIDAYGRDAAIIDLFISYRCSKGDKLPDLLGTMEAVFLNFYDQWLQNHTDRPYDAEYLQRATIGMCKIVARRDYSGSKQDSARDSRRMKQAEAICAMLFEPMAKPGGMVPIAATGSAPAP